MFFDILRDFRIGTTLLTILSDPVLAGITDVEGEDGQMPAPAFVSVCETNSTNPMPAGAIVHVPDGSVLAIVHELGQIKLGYEQTVLYAIRVEDRDKYPTFFGIGWMHWEEDRFFEAEGGMMSAAIARDVYDYLNGKPFYFFEDWKSLLIGQTQFESCSIEYTETERYLRLIGRK